ncbi:MAG: ribosome recycling factor, partial [Anaerolineae bacterium]
MIIINVPPLTEERRRELVKKAKAYGEETKIAIRNARHKAMDFIKKAMKEGYPEDLGKRMEEQVQELTNEYVKKVDELLKAKEADIMTI